MTHTPGPWEWKDDEKKVFGYYRIAPGVLLTSETDGTPWGDEIDKANARLITAAPELLRMLKVAQLWLDMDGRFDMQGINAAIAKAEGVSK